MTLSSIAVNVIFFLGGEEKSYDVGIGNV